MQGRHPVLKVLLLPPLGVLLALLAGEAFFRLFPGRLPEPALLRLHWREVTAGTRSHGHPYFGFLYPPDTRDEFARGDLQFAYRTDGQGFRNPDPWPEQAEIVAVGDSLTFSYGVGDEQAWTAQLRQRLPQQRVVNLGLIGACPLQYQRLFERFGQPLRPRVLLFGLFAANDVWDALQFERWLQAGAPGNYDVWRFQRSGRWRRLRDALGRSYLYTFAEESYQAWCSAGDYPARTLDFPDGRLLRLVPGVLQAATERARPGHPDFERVMEAIEGTRTLAAQQGTQLVVLLFPAKEEVYLPALGAPTPLPGEVFRQELERRGIRHLDLAVPLRARALEEPLYFEVDGHPNAAGYRIVAEAVAGYLQRHAAELGLAGS